MLDDRKPVKVLFELEKRKTDESCVGRLFSPTCLSNWEPQNHHLTRLELWRGKLSFNKGPRPWEKEKELRFWTFDPLFLIPPVVTGTRCSRSRHSCWSVLLLLRPLGPEIKLVAGYCGAMTWRSIFVRRRFLKIRTAHGFLLQGVAVFHRT